MRNNKGIYHDCMSKANIHKCILKTRSKQRQPWGILKIHKSSRGDVVNTPARAEVGDTESMKMETKL